MKKFIFLTFYFIITYSSLSASGNFSSPLRFYSKDILTYLQVLYNQQDYDKMINFMAGPIVDKNSKSQLINKLKDADFGYELKRVGINEVSKSEWNVTYNKTIIATQKSLKVRCILFRDTCRLWLDEKSFKEIFSNSK